MLLEVALHTCIECGLVLHHGKALRPHNSGSNLNAAAVSTWRANVAAVVNVHRCGRQLYHEVRLCCQPPISIQA